MADTAIERFKTDQALEEERKRSKTEKGEVRNVDEFKNSFLNALENISEPKKPVKYLKPLNPFGDDKSMARLITDGSPNLTLFLNTVLSKKEWLKLFKFIGYKGDNYFSTAKTLGLI